MPHAARSYVEAVVAADAAGAERIALACLDEGMSIEKLYADLLAPALWRIGQLWELGSISVADEGVATELTEHVMESAVAHTKSAHPRAGRVLLAAVAGQAHCLGIQMVGDVLRLDGFDIVHLGCDVSADTLFEEIESNKPDLVGLSFTMESAMLPAALMVAELSDHFPGQPLVLGGQAVGDRYSHTGKVIVSNDLSKVSGIAQDLIAA